MINTERRTLEELLARYDLEPELQDIYVEGSFDREVLSRCFEQNGQPGRIVYEVDSVEISGDILREEGFTEGNKQRLIAFARALASLGHEFRCRCLVDRDLDHWFGPLEVNQALVWTNYCSIELYFFTDELLQDLLIIAAKAQIEDWQRFLNSLTGILLDLYAMRLADRELQWSMGWLPAIKHLARSGSEIRFDATEYVKRLLMKNKRSNRALEFRAVLAKWRSSLSGDPRISMRGHDLVETLSWVIRAFRGIKELASVTAVERIFLLGASKAYGLLDLFPPSKTS